MQVHSYLFLFGCVTAYIVDRADQIENVTKKEYVISQVIVNEFANIMDTGAQNNGPIFF